MGRACKGREMGRGPLTEGRPGSGGKRRRRGWGRRFSPPGRLDDGRNGRGDSSGRRRCFAVVDRDLTGS
ncbi:hypothetical protein CDL15_Pgr029224 [Punica granatum]|uniref:Uncharacterized protein n=1 Tax=Punica granatum TaxID=22663 RepID=A0A218XD47_PUNGR|nr:hypothetical protein CDL15_Pgr029224 [Punica granatum]